MIIPERIGPEDAYKKVISEDALFVCAYDSEEKFAALKLQGAISVNEFKSMLPSLPKGREIIFYCA
jgi:rhodanese-related sulfurtransferase